MNFAKCARQQLLGRGGVALVDVDRKTHFILKNGHVQNRRKSRALFCFILCAFIMIMMQCIYCKTILKWIVLK